MTKGYLGAILAISMALAGSCRADTAAQPRNDNTAPTESDRPVSPGSDLYNERLLGSIDARTSALERDQSRADRQLAQASDKLNDIEKYLYVLITIVVAVVFAIIGAAKRVIRTRVERLIDDARKALQHETQNLDSQLQTKLDERFDADLKRVEEKLFLYVQITTLRFSKQYDEALSLASWEGDPKTFDIYPDTPRANMK